MRRSASFSSSGAVTKVGLPKSHQWCPPLILASLPAGAIKKERNKQARVSSESLCSPRTIPSQPENFFYQAGKANLAVTRALGDASFKKHNLIICTCVGFSRGGRGEHEGWPVKGILERRGCFGRRKMAVQEMTKVSVFAHGTAAPRTYACSGADFIVIGMGGLGPPYQPPHANPQRGGDDCSTPSWCV